MELKRDKKARLLIGEIDTQSSSKVLPRELASLSIPAEDKRRPIGNDQKTTDKYPSFLWWLF
jgi:hypothetical protein